MSPERAQVGDQAVAVARGWSGPDARPGWALTAALFDGLAADDELLAMAAEIPAGKLPALLFVASVQHLAAQSPGDPLAAYFPFDGRTPPPLDDAFRGAYRRFCQTHRGELAAVWDRHVYQMNEVARCAQVALALAVLHERAPDRAIALVDVGTGAGLGLLPDRYRYRIGDAPAFGDDDSPVDIVCDLQGPLRPRAHRLPPIGERVGIDVDPIDLDDDEARAWMAACVPPDASALRRVRGAIDVVRREPVTVVRGAALDALPGVLERCGTDLLICVVDAYTAVFFDEDERRAFRALLERTATGRDVAWISVDPLVPLGTEARHTVHGDAAPEPLVARNRRGGVFGVLSLTTHVDGSSRSEILAVAHPSGTRMEWLDAATATG